MNAVAQLAIIGVISAVAAGGSWLTKGPQEAVAFECDPALIREDEICLGDAVGNILWVDARSRSDWESNGIKGSILWNMDPKEDEMAFEADAAAHIVAAELVVVYCGSEACDTSRQIADRIRSLGLGAPVRVLHGGWDAIKGSSSAP
jgi:rhodanese-related sulfurtransferase